MLQKREMDKLLKENATHYADEGDFDLGDEVAAGNHEEMMNFLGEKFREVLIAIDGMPKKTERDSTRGKHSKENTAFVSGIPELAIEDDIRQLFSRYGTIERLTMFRHRKTQTFKGTAFVKFSSQEETDLVVDKLNETEFMGQYLTVTHANEYEPEHDNKNEQSGREQKRSTGPPERVTQWRKYNQPKLNDYRDKRDSMDVGPAIDRFNREKNTSNPRNNRNNFSREDNRDNRDPMDATPAIDRFHREKNIRSPRNNRNNFSAGREDYDDGLDKRHERPSKHRFQSREQSQRNERRTINQMYNDDDDDDEGLDYVSKHMSYSDVRQSNSQLNYRGDRHGERVDRHNDFGDRRGNYRESEAVDEYDDDDDDFDDAEEDDVYIHQTEAMRNWREKMDGSSPGDDNTQENYGIKSKKFKEVDFETRKTSRRGGRGRRTSRM